MKECVQIREKDVSIENTDVLLQTFQGFIANQIAKVQRKYSRFKGWHRKKDLLFFTV